LSIDPEKGKELKINKLTMILKQKD